MTHAWLHSAYEYYDDTTTKENGEKGGHGGGCGGGDGGSATTTTQDERRARKKAMIVRMLRGGVHAEVDDGEPDEHDGGGLWNKLATKATVLKQDIGKRLDELQDDIKSDPILQTVSKVTGIGADAIAEKKRKEMEPKLANIDQNFDLMVHASVIEPRSIVTLYYIAHCCVVWSYDLNGSPVLWRDYEPIMKGFDEAFAPHVPVLSDKAEEYGITQRLWIPIVQEQPLEFMQQVWMRLASTATEPAASGSQPQSRPVILQCGLDRVVAAAKQLVKDAMQTDAKNPAGAAPSGQSNEDAAVPQKDIPHAILPLVLYYFLIFVASDQTPDADAAKLFEEEFDAEVEIRFKQGVDGTPVIILHDKGGDVSKSMSIGGSTLRIQLNNFVEAGTGKSEIVERIREAVKPDADDDEDVNNSRA